MDVGCRGVSSTSYHENFKYVHSFMSSLLSSLLNPTASVSQTFRSYDILKMHVIFLSEMKMIDHSLHFYVIMMLIQLTPT